MRKYLPSLIVFVSVAVLSATIAVIAVTSIRHSDEARADLAAEAFWNRYEADVAGCDRGDITRTLLHDFLSAAEKARRSPPLEPGDIEAADKYAELDSRIWPLIPCTDLIPPPNVPRPQSSKEAT